MGMLAPFEVAAGGLGRVWVGSGSGSGWVRRAQIRDGREASGVERRLVGLARAQGCSSGPGRMGCAGCSGTRVFV